MYEGWKWIEGGIQFSDVESDNSNKILGQEKSEKGQNGALTSIMQ